MSSKTKGPNSVLISRGVSNVPIYDGRAETFEDSLFKVKNCIESEDDDSSFFFKEIEDHDDELSHEWMRSCSPGDIRSDKIGW